MPELIQIMLPFLMLIQGVIYLWTGIVDWKRSKDPKELVKKKRLEEQKEIKSQWEKLPQ